MRIVPIVLILAAFETLSACGAGPRPTPKAVPNYGSDVIQADELGLTSADDQVGGTGDIVIYNAAAVVAIPSPLNRGVKVLVNGKATFEARLAPALVTGEANDAQTYFSFVRDYYANTFGRLSYDGQGSPIRAAVDAQRFHLLDILGVRNNAAWIQPFKMFVFGEGGSELGGFASAVDVIGHEFTHAVISSTSKLAPGGQSGALNEHLADVFGEMIQHRLAPESRPFLIGESVLRGKLAKKAAALRDMLHPEKSLDPQPTQMNEIDDEYKPGCIETRANDLCGVHLLNGVPNRAAALIIQAIGWDTAEKLFYTVMTERLTANSDFIDYRNQMVQECEATLPRATCDQVSAAFQTVGL